MGLLLALQSLQSLNFMVSYYFAVIIHDNTAVHAYIIYSAVILLTAYIWFYFCRELNLRSFRRSRYINDAAKR